MNMIGRDMSWIDEDGTYVLTAEEMAMIGEGPDVRLETEEDREKQKHCKIKDNEAFRKLGEEYTRLLEEYRANK